MVKISVLNDCLKSMYNAEKRGKRQVRRSPVRCGGRRVSRGRGTALGGPAFLLASRFKAPEPHRRCD